MTKQEIQDIRELAIAIKSDCAHGSRVWMRANKILEITQKVSNQS